MSMWVYGKDKQGRSVIWTIPFDVMSIVFILGILAAFVVPNVIGASPRARAMRANADLQTISMALEEYRTRSGAFPSSGQGLNVLVEQGILARLPVDSWDHPFQYESDGSTFLLRCLGADGKSGGIGYDADIEVNSTSKDSPRPF